MLIRTAKKGAFTFIGSSQMFFGRDDGLNEKGLSISISSCGLSGPSLHISKHSRVAGIHYWAAMRLVLERCATVLEALETLKNLELTSNVNLLMADKDGHLGLYNSMFGNVDISYYNAHELSALQATNHTHREKMRAFGQSPSRNSLIREKRMADFLQANQSISLDDMKDLFLTAYPIGMYFNHYLHALGTLKSVVRDLNALTYDICWGGNLKNGWDRFSIHEPFAYRSKNIIMENEHVRGRLR